MSPPWGKRELALSGLLVALTLLCYSGAARLGFVSFDDPAYVTSNREVLAGLTGHGVRWAFSTGFLSNWHPLTWLSHMLDVALFGVRPGPHHLVNVALHGLNTLLVFAFLRRATGRTGASAVVAALFCAHPLHVESVAWVSERKDLLSTFFGLVALVAWVGYARRQGWKAWALAFATFALSLLAKPMLVTLPFVLLLLDLWPLGRLGAGWTRLVREKVPFFALSAASAIVTFNVQRASGAAPPLHWPDVPYQLATALWGYCWYVAKLLWPTGLAVLHPHPWLQGGVPLTALEIGGSVAALAAVSWAAWRARAQPAVLMGWLWFLGTLVPVIGLVRIGTLGVAERYTYVPLLGLFIALAFGAEALVERFASARRAVLPAVVVMLAACVVLTRAQVAVWTNSVTLFNRAVAVHPQSALLRDNLARGFAAAGRADDALAEFESAVAIDSHDGAAWTEIANARFTRGRVPEALDAYQRAVEASPDSPQAHYDFGRALWSQGRLAEARAQYEQTLRVDPDHPQTHVNLARILLTLDDATTALAHAERAATLTDRSQVPVLEVLADAYAANGQPDVARATLRAAAELARRTGAATEAQRLEAKLGE